MDPKAIMPTLNKDNEVFSNNKGVDPHSKGHGTDNSGDSSYDNFSKDIYLSSIFFPCDTKDLSLASLSLDSGIVLDESTKFRYSLLPPNSDVAASMSSNTNISFNIVATVSEETGLIGECDTIDGMIIRSFTTMDHLEQFVAKSVSTQNFSPCLKKVKEITASTHGYIEKDMHRMDAAFFVLSEEPYYDDYNVPFPLNNSRLLVECKKRFCTMGCICDSLNSTRPQSEHCNHTECMLNSACSYKQMMCYRDSSSPIKRYDTQEFFEFSQHALLKELSSMKKEIYIKMDIIERLTSELSEKQLEIDNLKKKITEKTIFRSNVTLRPLAVKSDTSSVVINVKTMEDKKVKNKEKSKFEIKQEVQCRRMMAKVEVKDAKVKTRRSHVGGLFVDSYPFDESILDRLAENTTFSIFVRQLMRKMFTWDFLSSKSLTQMKEEHVAAITDAAMKRFKFYHKKNGKSVRVTPQLVKMVLRSELNVKQTQKKKKTK